MIWESLHHWSAKEERQGASETASRLFSCSTYLNANSATNFSLLVYDFTLSLEMSYMYFTVKLVYSKMQKTMEIEDSSTDRSSAAKGNTPLQDKVCVCVLCVHPRRAEQSKLTACLIICHLSKLDSFAFVSIYMYYNIAPCRTSHSWSCALVHALVLPLWLGHLLVCVTNPLKLSLNNTLITLLVGGKIVPHNVINLIIKPNSLQERPTKILTTTPSLPSCID